MKRRHVILAVVAVAAGTVAGYGVLRNTAVGRSEAVQAGGNASAGVGDVPDALWALTLPDLDGTAQSMAQWRGKRTVVNFWATWCAPCVKEMPDLDALAKKHENVKFVGIGIDSTANIRAFHAKVPVAYPLIVFETGGVDMLRQLGNTQGGLPFTLILDEEGRIMHRVLGQIDAQDLDKRLSA